MSSNANENGTQKEFALRKFLRKSWTCKWFIMHVLLMLKNLKMFNKSTYDMLLI